MIKVIKCDEIHQCDEILLTLLKTYDSDDSLSDENQPRWWKPLWWKFITVIEIYTLIFDKNLLVRWKFITMMNIYHTDEIYHHDENYHQAHQIEDMRSAHEPNQHCLT